MTQGSNPSSTLVASPLERAYHQVGDIAEHIAQLETDIADLDDDQLSIDLNELQQAVLQIDRHLRSRRRAH